MGLRDHRDWVIFSTGALSVTPTRQINSSVVCTLALDFQSLRLVLVSFPLDVLVYHEGNPDLVRPAETSW